MLLDAVKRARMHVRHVLVPQQMPAVVIAFKLRMRWSRESVISMGAFAPPLSAPYSWLPCGLPQYGGDVTDLWIGRGAICWLTITKAKLEPLTSSGPTRCIGRSSVHALNHTRHQFPHLILFWDCHVDIVQKELNFGHSRIDSMDIQ